MESKSGIKPVFFLDRTHGQRTSRILQSVGINVIPHRQWFVHDTPDPEWIAKCGKEAWVVLSGDKSIESVPENRQAVIEAKCKVFFFNDTNSLPEEWAAAVIVGRPRLYEIIARNDGPFFVTIERNTRRHISSIRFVGSGAPKPAEAPASSESPTLKPLSRPPIEPTQRVLPLKPFAPKA